MLWLSILGFFFQSCDFFFLSESLEEAENLRRERGINVWKKLKTRWMKALARMSWKTPMCCSSFSFLTIKYMHASSRYTLSFSLTHTNQQFTSPCFWGHHFDDNWPKTSYPMILQSPSTPFSPPKAINIVSWNIPDVAAQHLFSVSVFFFLSFFFWSWYGRHDASTFSGFTLHSEERNTLCRGSLCNVSISAIQWDVRTVVAAAMLLALTLACVPESTFTSMLLFFFFDLDTVRFVFLGGGAQSCVWQGVFAQIWMS